MDNMSFPVRKTEDKMPFYYYFYFGHIIDTMFFLATVFHSLKAGVNN